MGAIKAILDAIDPRQGEGVFTNLIGFAEEELKLLEALAGSTTYPVKDTAGREVRIPTPRDEKRWEFLSIFIRDFPTHSAEEISDMVRLALDLEEKGDG